jgi:hypothetical protein
MGAPHPPDISPSPIQIRHCLRRKAQQTLTSPTYSGDRAQIPRAKTTPLPLQLTPPLGCRSHTIGHFEVRKKSDDH